VGIAVWGSRKKDASYSSFNCDVKDADKFSIFEAVLMGFA
jgi:hypothetical protein